MELDIERNQRAFKEFLRLGSRGVPVILIGKTKVDGFNANKLQQVLLANHLIPSPQPPPGGRERERSK